MRPEKITSKLSIQKKTIAIMINQAELDTNQTPYLRAGNDIRFVPSLIEICTSLTGKPEKTKGGF